MSLHDDIINHAKLNLERAGIGSDQLLHKNVMGLISVFAGHDHNAVPRHVAADLFQKLAKFENLPSARISGAIDVSSLLPGLSKWQKYIIEQFERNGFTNLPESFSSQSAMWKYSTYSNTLSDIIDHGGAMQAVVLSMAFKPKIVAEFGIHGGFTTLLFCRSNPEARVYAVDVHSRMPDADLPIGCAAMMHMLPNISIEIMNSWEFKMPGKVGLCFIDGEHVGNAPYLDSLTAWENRDASGDWCIAWDDYHPNNPDVKSAVDRFVSEVGMTLNTLGTWVWIGNKSPSDLQEFMA